jgi:hypothetical protein
MYHVLKQLGSRVDLALKVAVQRILDVFNCASQGLNNFNISKKTYTVNVQKDMSMNGGVDVTLHTGIRQTRMFSFMLRSVHSFRRSADY